jgi:hypothetical protein
VQVAPALTIGTPLSQISLEPNFKQVYFFAPTTEVALALLQLAPGFAF